MFTADHRYVYTYSRACIDTQATKYMVKYIDTYMFSFVDMSICGCQRLHARTHTQRHR